MARFSSTSPPRWALPSALTCGVLGVIANVFLIGFFALTYPSFADGRWGWLGFANDVIGIGYFAALAPVIWAVARLLPASRPVTVITVLALVASVGLVTLSIALVVDALTFEVQVRYVVALLVVFYGWLLVVSSIGHRASSLPRSVTRFGLLLGMTWPAALLLMVAGGSVGGVHLGPFELGMPGALLVVPGLLLGTLNWMLLPLWPLGLAGTVFAPRWRGRQVSTLAAGPDHAGPDHAGPDHADPDHADPDHAEVQR